MKLGVDRSKSWSKQIGETLLLSSFAYRMMGNGLERVWFARTRDLHFPDFRNITIDYISSRRIWKQFNKTFQIGQIQKTFNMNLRACIVSWVLYNKFFNLQTTYKEQVSTSSSVTIKLVFLMKKRSRFFEGICNQNTFIVVHFAKKSNWGVKRDTIRRTILNIFDRSYLPFKLLKLAKDYKTTALKHL